MSYGVGGQYEPHWDAFGLHNDEGNAGTGAGTMHHRDKGDRIATFTYYLESVERANGGGTVFPDLGLAAFPPRGSALFWYNLRRDGRRLEESVHAGCPVLHGTKLITINVFREASQMFKKPCDIIQDPDDSGHGL